MNFINPNILWALPLILIWALFWWIYGDSQRRKVLSTYLHGNAGKIISYPARFRRRFLLLLGIALLVVAAARPHWGVRPLEFNVAEADVLAVFDVSKSMLAEDVAPSRIEHGKWLLKKVAQANNDANFGIVAFAGKAFLSCPVTGDRVSLEQCIDELECDLVPVGGTNLAEALNTALKALQSAGGTTRDMILITDGEELTGDVTRILEKIKKSGVRLLIAGIGDPAVPALIPEVDRNGQKHFKRDNAGNLVRTRLNEDLLRKIAAESGGIYINSSSLEPGIARISSWLKQDKTTSGKVVKRSLPIERFMIFLILGSLCVTLYLIGSEVPWRKNVICLLGVLLLFDPAETLAEPVQNIAGNTAGLEEKIDNTARSAGSPENRPDDYTVYNRARKLHLENKTSEAAGLYSELIKSGSMPGVRLASLHNLGVIGHTAGRKMFSESALAAHNGDLDKALKTLEQAEQELLRAEELYVNVMKNPQAGEITSQTQQKLLLDREEIKKFRKDLEELKKLQQQAQNKTQQAQDKNKSQQDQQKQVGQNQPPQGQNQPPQGQNQAKKQSAQDALKEAQKAVDDLRKDAEKKSQPKISDMARSAAEALKDAAGKQKQGDFKGAEKDIEKARQALGAGQQENKDSDRKNSENQDKSGKQDNKSDDSQPQDSGKKSQNDNKMDKQQTDALLDLMSRDEKMLRDAIKNQRNRRIAPVEKDW